MNEIILSLGGIIQLHGICPSDATNEQLADFLGGITYAADRQQITVAEVRQRQTEVEAEATAREKAVKSIDALRYLASTDWYILRQQESGKPVPANILTERQQARDSIR